jgi:hypothetical protein
MIAPPSLGRGFGFPTVKRTEDEKNDDIDLDRAPVIGQTL